MNTSRVCLGRKLLSRNWLLVWYGQNHKIGSFHISCLLRCENRHNLALEAVAFHRVYKRFYLLGKAADDVHHFESRTLVQGVASGPTSTSATVHQFRFPRGL